LEADVRLKPKLHVFGHVHGAHGMLSTEDTLFVNAALLGPGGDLSASPVVLRIPEFDVR
jgi:Icc-related predicted phosphoesterase